jgi:hypothetical protein
MFGDDHYNLILQFRRNQFDVEIKFDVDNFSKYPEFSVRLYNRGNEEKDELIDKLVNDAYTACGAYDFCSQKPKDALKFLLGFACALNTADYFKLTDFTLEQPYTEVNKQDVNFEDMVQQIQHALFNKLQPLMMVESELTSTVNKTLFAKLGLTLLFYPLRHLPNIQQVSDCFNQASKIYTEAVNSPELDATQFLGYAEKIHSILVQAKNVIEQLPDSIRKALFFKETLEKAKWLEPIDNALNLYEDSIANFRFCYPTSFDDVINGFESLDPRLPAEIEGLIAGYTAVAPRG